MMKKILIFLFLTGAAFAEDGVIVPDATTEIAAEGRAGEGGGTIDAAKTQPDDFTGRFWLQYGINGSLTFRPNSGVVRKINEIIGQKTKMNNAFVGAELRLGYNVNHWLGLWIGGIWAPYAGGLDFITVRKQEQWGPPELGITHDTFEMYDLTTDIEYKEYFAGARMRIGEAGGFLFSWMKRYVRLYWFADFGLSCREMTVEYSSHDFGISGITDRMGKTAPYFGTGTEIMFGKRQSINISANAADFLSKIGTFGMSIFFKGYF